MMDHYLSIIDCSETNHCEFYFCRHEDEVAVGADLLSPAAFVHPRCIACW